MTYQVIQPPFTLKFREMSKAEIRDYGIWFHAIFEERMSELEAEIRTDPRFQNWQVTYEPDSLDQLGEWFAGAVTSRARAPEEIIDLKLQGDFRFPVSDQELTNKTFSMAIDVGMYLARTFKGSFPQLKWKQFTDNKRFADYGQPVLIGLGKVPINPVRMVIVLAYGVMAGSHTGKQLKEAFEYWSKQAT